MKSKNKMIVRTIYKLIQTHCREKGKKDKEVNTIEIMNKE